jgi:protein SDA1
LRKLQHQRTINKKTKSRDAQMKRLHKVSVDKRKDKADKANVQVNFPALQLLNDPQSFGEKLYEGMSRHDKHYALEHKVLIMQLLSRVMGAHKLCILGFYSYIIKYLTYHQLLITLILVSLAQSVHELTPPDVLTPVVRKIAAEFVHPGVGSEVVAAGINAIREVCRRQPWCMEEDLLGDLIEYRKSKDKGVVTASRGLLQLFREVNPGLLKRRERGKAATMGLTADQVPEYGHARTAEGIDGLDLLEEHLAKQEAGEDNDANGWDDWEQEASDDDSDGSGEWNNVYSDDDQEIDISDSDDDAETQQTRREKKREQQEKRKKALAGQLEDDQAKPTATTEGSDDEAEEDEEVAEDEGAEDEGEDEDAEDDETAADAASTAGESAAVSMSKLATERVRATLCCALPLHDN